MSKANSHETTALSPLPVEDRGMIIASEGPFTALAAPTSSRTSRFADKSACDDPDAEMMDDFVRRGAHDDDNPYE